MTRDERRTEERKGEGEGGRGGQGKGRGSGVVGVVAGIGRE